mmetsp:Transcript_119543/g.345636  ORF Transcript_119543/g.345636 Transcript_119543/m.345636 type:complete len:233 (-) Transcript_119543:895-1593(-)
MAGPRPQVGLHGRGGRGGRSAGAAPRCWRSPPRAAPRCGFSSASSVQGPTARRPPGPPLWTARRRGRREATAPRPGPRRPPGRARYAHDRWRMGARLPPGRVTPLRQRRAGPPRGPRNSGHGGMAPRRRRSPGCRRPRSTASARRKRFGQGRPRAQSMRGRAPPGWPAGARSSRSRWGPRRRPIRLGQRPSRGLAKSPAPLLRKRRSLRPGRLARLYGPMAVGQDPVDAQAA